MSTKPLLAGFGLVLVLGAAVLGLRSLEKAAGPAAAPRADSSRQAKPADEISAPAPDAAFALHACRVHMQDQAPQLELHFTQPLQAEGGGWASLTVADLGPLQGATPASAAAGATPQGQRVRGYWRQTEDARVLRFAGVQPQRRYRVQAGEGLKSVDGVALPAVAHCELATTPTPPAHYFASRGTVLPAGQNGGLPVATVNTPEVDVQFLRVAPAALPRFLERLAGGRNPGAADDEGEGGYDDPGNSLQGRTSGWQLEQWKAYAEPVHLARYRTEGPADQRRNHFLPVEHIAELQQPGVYLAVMNRPGRFDNDYQVTHFYVSDIGLQLQRQSEGLSVFVSSLKSGKALAGVRVELLDAHGRLKVAQDSDADGHARFERPPAEATLALARQGAQLTPLRLREAGLDLSEFDIGGHPSRSVRLFAYAGRDLYRPGEALTLSVLARDADGQPGAAQPLQATLRQPDGRSVSSETWLPDPARPGYLQHALRLSADAPTGTWTLELRHDPASKEPTTAWRFQVEEFLPERMKLALTAPATLAGAFEVQVQGDYLYGAPAAGNRLVVQAASERQREALPRQWPGFVFGDVDDDARRTRQPVADAQLDAQGQAQVSLPLPDRNASPMRVTGSFSLLESGGRPVVRSIERVVWPAPVLLAIRPGFERDVAAESGMARFELIRVDAAGRAQPARGLQLRLLREDRQYHWRFDEQRGWHSGYVDTESLVLERAIDLGASRQSVDLPLSWGRFRIEIEDPETRLKLRYRFYGGWSAQEAERIGSRPDRVKLAWVKGSTGAEAPFKAGHTARLAITPPHEGEALVTVQSGARLLWLKRMTLPAAGSTVDIPLGQGPDWARHDLYATVTALRPGSQGERVTPARAVGLLHLPLDRRERALKLTLTAPAKSEPERRVAVKTEAGRRHAGRARPGLGHPERGGRRHPRHHALRQPRPARLLLRQAALRARVAGHVRPPDREDGRHPGAHALGRRRRQPRHAEPAAQGAPGRPVQRPGGLRCAGRGHGGARAARLQRPPAPDGGGRAGRPLRQGRGRADGGGALGGRAFHAALHRPRRPGPAGARPQQPQRSGADRQRAAHRRCAAAGRRGPANRQPRAPAAPGAALARGGRRRLRPGAADPGAQGPQRPHAATPELAAAAAALGAGARRPAHARGARREPRARSGLAGALPPGQRPARCGPQRPAAARRRAPGAGPARLPLWLPGADRQQRLPAAVRRRRAGQGLRA
jgi:uncharacterized protein YfaS (alpha-2-macroglobulin family)